jgi:hypothetical protein
MTNNDINIDIVDNETIEFNVVDAQDINFDFTVTYYDADSFLQLLDVPKTYTGQANKLVAVKSDESGLEFTDSPTVVDWGEINGTLSDQEDLQDALDLKYDAADFNTDFSTQFATKTTDDLTEGATNLYDKTIVLNSGSGISATGIYPNFTITNTDKGTTAVSTHESTYVHTDIFHKLTDDTDDITEGATNKFDKTVTLTQGSNITITGSYPNFTIAATDTDTNDKVKYDANDLVNGYLKDKTIAGTGISLSEGTGGDVDKLQITNSDTGSSAVSAHNLAYDHTKIATALQTDQTIPQTMTGLLDGSLILENGVVKTKVMTPSFTYFV